MKQFLLLTLTIFLSITTYCQLDITKGEVSRPIAEYRKSGEMVAELYRYVLPISGDTMYSISYYDDRYSHIKSRESFAIVGTDNMKQFFSVIAGMYYKKDRNAEYTIPVAAGEEVSARWSRNDIMLLIKNRHGNYSSLIFTKKILEKLNVF